MSKGTTAKHVTNAIPHWIFGYALFLTALSFGMALVGYLQPSIAFGEQSSPGPETAFYAARNLAIGVMFAVALYRKSVSMLGLVFVGRLVVELADLVATLAYGLVAMHSLLVIATWLVIFLVPELFAVKYLLAQSRKNELA